MRRLDQVEYWHIGYGVSRGIYVTEVLFSLLLLQLLKSNLCLQMYRDSFASQVVYSQYTAYYVPAQVVEDQHFPYWISIFIEKSVAVELTA